MKKKLFIIIKVVICLFALIGLTFTGVFVAQKEGWTNAISRVDNQRQGFLASAGTPIYSTTAWQDSPEWATFKAAIVKDEPVIDKEAAIAGVSPRLLMSICAVEQMRLYSSERDYFKQVFSPLNILGTQSQFSLGVMGIKEDTAKQIEDNLKDATSTFYLGNNDEHLLDFTTSDPDAERFNRLTSYTDRSWSYLYAALYLKEIETEWQHAGFPISDPGVLATLFNIGFAHSNPNATPQIGGADIPFNGTDYTFGSFAHDIYYSNELSAEFPK